MARATETIGEFSLVELIAGHRGVKLREFRIPNYAGDHPSRNKRVEKLWTTGDGTFVVPRREVERLIAARSIVPLDNDPDLWHYVTPAMEAEFEEDVRAHYEVEGAQFEASVSTKH
jgi:hypothetical protein